MIYTVKCFICKKEGRRGVFSRHVQPDNWFVVGWMSEHSEHLEAVCSVDCLHSFTLHADDVPKNESFPEDENGES